MRKNVIVALGLLSLLGTSYSATAQFACGDFKNIKSTAAVPNLDHSALSDTFDIISTHVALDLTALPTNHIVGHATMQVQKRQATNRFLFELDSYSIDSAKIGNQTVTFGQSAAGAFRYLDIPSGTWAVSTVEQVDIWYSGSGQADPTGWGGWHQSSPYFFNLGVGFGSNPHSYGRSLFPAFDNFVEHSLYSFDILTSGGRKAYANGTRTQLVNTSGDTLLQSWDCTDPMSAYLASVAVSNYAEIEGTLSKLNGSQVPMLLLARPADTANVKASFAHLQQILTAYETWFGEYVWDKVGYAMTTQGAMEHATSIHLPLSLANGTFQGEDIIAHELAHHWWGNLVTCETAEDMWINEGMAEFSSHLYVEEVYNRERYMRDVRGNQLLVLNYAQASNRDGAYLALNGVDHSTTYGTHVYQKGAWIGHNLRGYMGDSLFKYGTSTMLQQNSHNNLTTSDFKLSLGFISNMNLSNFFSDWITTPGHVAISIDSVRALNSGGFYTVSVGVTQNRKARSTYLADAPMTVILYGPNGEIEERKVNVTSSTQVFTLNNVDFNPTFATINEGEEYLAGTTFEHVKGQGFNLYNMDAAKGKLLVNTSSDTHEVYIAHHWAGPEQRSNLANLSKGRFWTIRGTWGNDFDGTFKFFYDARAQNGSLDADLVTTTEDSLVVMYRPDAGQPWQYYPHFTQNFMGSHSDGFGEITITELASGDFVLANAGDDIGLVEPTQKNPLLKVFPNPTEGEIIIQQYASASSESNLEVLSMDGKLSHSQAWKLNAGWNELRLSLDMPQATYIVRTAAGEEKVMLVH